MKYISKDELQNELDKLWFHTDTTYTDMEEGYNAAIAKFNEIIQDMPTIEIADDDTPEPEDDGKLNFGPNIVFAHNDHVYVTINNFNETEREWANDSSE